MKKVNDYSRVDPPLTRSLDAKSVSMIGKIFMALIALGVVGVAVAGIGMFNTQVLGVGKGATGADGAPGVSATLYSLQDIAQILLAGNITLIAGPAGANSTVPGPTGIVNLTNAHLVGGGSWTGGPTIDSLSIANDLTVAHNVRALGAVSANGFYAGNSTILTTGDMTSGTLTLQSQSVLSLDTQGGIHAVSDIQTTTGGVKTALASMNSAGVVSGTQITTGTAGATMDSAGVISGTSVTTGTAGATMDSTGLITGTHVTIGSASMDSTGIISGTQVSVGSAVTLDNTGVTSTVVKVSGNTITNSLTSNSATIDHADFTNYMRASHIHSLAGILNIADSANTTDLFLGTGPNMNNIFYGTGLGPTNHYLGGQLDNIYITGNLVAVNATYVTETNLAVANKTIYLNNGGLPGSSGLAGLCIQDGSVNTTICARQSLTRNSWQLQSALGPLVVLDQDLQKAASPTFVAVTAPSITASNVTASNGKFVNVNCSALISANGGIRFSSTTAALTSYDDTTQTVNGIFVLSGWPNNGIGVRALRIGPLVMLSITGPSSACSPSVNDYISFTLPSSLRPLASSAATQLFIVEVYSSNNYVEGRLSVNYVNGQVLFWPGTSSTPGGFQPGGSCAIASTSGLAWFIA